jgi:hypothetical protein
MGCFGYMCVGCHKSVRAGEKAVFKHVRHGEVLGEATGTADEYGCIEEDPVYRNDDKDNVNNHLNIWYSEFELLDSEGFDSKIYLDKPYNWIAYIEAKGYRLGERPSPEDYAEWESLPTYVQPAILSGTEAWHKYCYDHASEKKRARHIIAKSDPHQSWGKPRPQYR